jgi:curved DNA-binding protein CbpA
MKGVLAQRCPADILSEVLRRQMSGILSLRRGPTNRQVFLDTGSTIRFAASNHPDESLVGWLMEKGGVTEAQVREATSRKEPHELLGTVLARLGHLTASKLHDLTESHIRRVLAGALRMNDGEWEFQQGALPFRDQLDADVRSAEALLEWTRSLTDAEWIRRRLGPIDTRVHRDRRPPEGYQSIRLDPVEGFIMSRVDGAATIREICLVSPTGEEKTLAALFGLSLAGILEPPPGSEAVFPPAMAGEREAAAGPPVSPYTAATPPKPEPAVPAKPPASPTATTGKHPALSVVPPAAPRPAAAPSAQPAGAPAAAARPVGAPAAGKGPAAPAKPGARPGLKPGGRPGLRPGSRPGAPARPRPAPVAAAARRPAEPAKLPEGADLESEMLARHADLHNQDLYHALGVASTAATDEIRRAYYALARRYHPDKFRNEAIKDKAEQVFARITEAYSTLSDHEARSRYDGEMASHRGSADRGASDTTDLARENFRRGRDELDRGRFSEALAFLMHACEQDPSRSEYFEYLGVTQGRNPRLRKQAEESLLKAIALSPTNAGAYVHLAELYERAGALDPAKEMYRKALAWDPDHPAAKRALEAGQQPAKRGLLGGLFGRK